MPYPHPPQQHRLHTETHQDSPPIHTRDSSRTHMMAECTLDENYSSIVQAGIR